MAGITRQEREERERLAELGLKQCSEKAGCGQIKSVEEFGAHKGRWDKKQTVCRMCDRERANQYAKENREAQNAYSQQYYRDNLEAKLAYAHQYRTENPEARREYYAKRSQEDPMYYRLNEGKARAKKAGAEWDNISTTELLSHWKLRDITIDTCYYCKQSIDEGELEIDHGIPICSGGSHTLDNLYPCHRSCNRQKNNKNVNEYLEHLKQAV